MDRQRYGSSDYQPPFDRDRSRYDVGVHRDHDTGWRDGSRDRTDGGRAEGVEGWQGRSRWTESGGGADRTYGGYDDQFSASNDGYGSRWTGDHDPYRQGREWETRSFRSPGRHRGRGPKDYVRSDDRIREDVNDRLADDGNVDATDISVQVSEGEVTLTGTVEDRHAKRRAEDCADAVSGVRHVQNNLRFSSRPEHGAAGAETQI
ncbi:BON domain-containing protein [Brevundimonas staleyi]|uniref:BON domain-containing protein n=1 Tax=Brevundimonas staleyi TaxID=74326 RepID=A0ABW0FUY3_9CAUL